MKKLFWQSNKIYIQVWVLMMIMLISKKIIDDNRDGEHNYGAANYGGGSLGKGSYGGGSIGGVNIGSWGAEGSF